MPRKSPAERFWAKVDKSGGCWTWTAAMNRNGYGLFGIPRGTSGSRLVMAHRFAYELVVGPVPEGLVLDHLCRNRACVNPDHLEPVTELENQRRGEYAGRTHCPHGHPYDAENTYVRRGPSGQRHRQCRTCHRDRMRRRSLADSRAAA